MRIYFKILLCAIILLGNNWGLASSEENSNYTPKKIRIAAGDLLDGYYMIGLKLCRYISNSNEGIRCEVVPTSGSLENLELLQKGKVDFAFTMSNLAVDLYKGKNNFDGQPLKELRQLLSLHDVYFTVISKDEDHINTFQDLEGKRISNGPPSSDSTEIYNQIFSLYDFKQRPQDIEELYENYAKRYCAGEIDALMITTGHPNVLVNMITHKCESDFVSMDQDKIDILTKDNELFHKKKLKKHMYPGITEDQYTIATRAILVTNESLNQKITEKFLNYISTRFSQLRLADEVLNKLDIKDFTSGFVLPKFTINFPNN